MSTIKTVLRDFWLSFVDVMSFVINLSFVIGIVFIHNPPYLSEAQKKSRVQAHTEVSSEEIVYFGGINLASVMNLDPFVPIRITYSQGGTDSGMWRMMIHRVIIDGECVSACTWLFVLSPFACYTDNAKFVFHGWQREYILTLNKDLVFDQRHFKLGWKLRVPMDVVTNEYMKLLPEAVGKTLVTLPYTDDTINLSDQLLNEVYANKKCKTAGG